MADNASRGLSGGNDGQVVAGESLVARYINFVKLPHTLFALPFALLGLLAASFTHSVGPRTLGLVVLAFTAARWVAMGFNRIVDRNYDALNPRTHRRELPQGRLSLLQAWGSVLVAGAVFILASRALNPLCGMLSPFAFLQAVHLLASPLAGSQSGHCPGGWVPGDRWDVEHAVVDTGGDHHRRGVVGGWFRCVLRPARQGL